MHAKSPQSQLSQLSGHAKLRGLPKLPANTVPPFSLASANYKACCTVMRRAQAPCRFQTSCQMANSEGVTR